MHGTSRVELMRCNLTSNTFRRLQPYLELVQVSKRFLADDFDEVAIQIQATKLPQSGERLLVDIVDDVAPQQNLAKPLRTAKEPRRDARDTIGPQLEPSQRVHPGQQPFRQRPYPARPEMKFTQRRLQTFQSAGADPIADLPVEVGDDDGDAEVTEGSRRQFGDLLAVQVESFVRRSSFVVVDRVADGELRNGVQLAAADVPERRATTDAWRSRLDDQRSTSAIDGLRRQR